MLDITSHTVLVKDNKTLNAESTIGFFMEIEESYPTKKTAHIFCDNARYYKHKEIRN